MADRKGEGRVSAADRLCWQISIVTHSDHYILQNISGRSSGTESIVGYLPETSNGLLTAPRRHFGQSVCVRVRVCV
jgi:hypothetical protein